MTLVISDVPTQAVMFLILVAFFLMLLGVFALYLNRLLCFARCGGFPCIDRIPHASRESSTNPNTDDTAGADDETSSDESDEDVQRRYQLLRRSASGSTIRSLPRSGSDRSTTTIASRTTVATVTAAPASSTTSAGPVTTTTTATVSAAADATAADSVSELVDLGVESGAAKTEAQGSAESSGLKEQNQPQDHVIPIDEGSKLHTAEYSVLRETPQSGSNAPSGLEGTDITDNHSLQDLISHDIPDSQPPKQLESHDASVKQPPQGLESHDVTSHQSQQELESRDTLTNQSPQAFGSRDIPVSQSPQGLGSHDSVHSQSSQRQKSSSPPQGDPSSQVGETAIPMEAVECGASDCGKSINGQVGSVTYENQAFQSEVPETATLTSITGSEQALIAGNDEHLFDVSDLQHEPPLISKCGSLEVTFTYQAVRGKMTVHVHRAREIPTKDRGGANSTQVRIMLLPTKKQRFKTKVKEGEEPVFDETFVFSKIFTDEIPGLGVRFRLYGLERMRREYMIGESVIGFASLTLTEPSTHWIILEPRSNLSHGDSGFDVSSLSRSDSASSMQSVQSLQHGGMPELLVGLAYHGTTGRLAVQVVKGSNFRNMATNRPPDTYVKVTLMSPSGQEVQNCKTSIRRGQPNPLFKETFMLQVAQFQLPEVTLMVSVYNKKSMKKKEMIGWFSLGQNSSGEEEGSHWADMRESKGDEVCRWHVLLES